MLSQIINGIANHLEIMSGMYSRMKEVQARIGDYAEFSKEDELYVVLGKPEEKPKNDLGVTGTDRSFDWDKVRKSIDSLVYSAEDRGDDETLRAVVNRRIDDLEDRVPGEERWEKWMRVYRRMTGFAVVDFPEEVRKYKEKKIAEGKPKSPTGYDWSWINLAVSNEYWSRLLIICIEIEESKDRR